MAQQHIGKDLRVFYTRTGAVRYTSHLDVNRCMQRALARSRLPIWYTQGFNPHLYITFALPTPLGYESMCETMDFRILEDLPYEEIRDRLNACLPTGFRVLRVAPPCHTSEEIRFADYDAWLSAPGKAAAELRRRLDVFLEQDQILVEKKTKKGTKQLDLKPLMELLELTEEDTDTLRVRLRLAAGGQMNVNPTLVFEAFEEQSHLVLDCVRVIKRQAYVETSPIVRVFE